MSDNQTYEKLQKLMHSYVPEFAYEHGASDPGCVLTDLCGTMMEESRERYGKVIPRHRIQYLNLFEHLLKEPVSASRAYVQFRPVSGYEGKVAIPAGTQVLSPSSEAGDIVFQTEHGMTISDTAPELIVVTDREQDRIIKRNYSEQNPTSFRAFGTEGVNCTVHQLYLCFENLFDWMSGLDLFLQVQAGGEEDQDRLLKFLTGDQVRWSMLETDGEERIFTTVEETDGRIHLLLPDYQPQKAMIGQKEGYYLVLTCLEGIQDLYIRSLSLTFAGENKVPEEVYLNGNEEPAGNFLPFGKPLGLYNECSIDDREVLSRRGAKVSMSFLLNYRIHEEKLELPEMELEYKAIMKKPREQLNVRPAEVLADYVCWEYLSETGWKRLLKDERTGTMFNGSVEGPMTMEFICPEDMAEYDPERRSGRIRLRLLQAENIYRMPAIYKCPVMAGLSFSYTYEQEMQLPVWAMTRNNFEEKNITEDLRSQGVVNLFYETEHRRRTMYLGFSGSVAGTPLSLYFDIENYGDRPISFQVEYLSSRGFQPVKTADYTDGFSGSGNLLLMIPDDIQKTTKFGYEGYFLRFINYNRENPEHALPVIHGIYPNMARVANVNTVTEEFYLEDEEAAVHIQLSQQNLLKAEVFVREQTEEGEEWIPWRQSSRSVENGRSCQLDMASGELFFRKHQFSGFRLAEEGPHIRVLHSNYSGSVANVPAGAITIPGTAIRYLSEVTNPFPAYGGYDGYTEETAMRLVSGMLRTRNRAVTRKDFAELIAQESYGIRKVKCVNQMNQITIAVLVEEYEKGAHVFSGIKKAIRDRLLRDSALMPSGKSLTLIQPHFIRMNVRVWLEKDSMDQAYDLQQRALAKMTDFINPLKGGVSGQGWEIGELPRASQLTAVLRTGLPGCSITRMVITAQVNGQEYSVTDEFYENLNDPFAMAVNGEHMVYIEVSGC